MYSHSPSHSQCAQHHTKQQSELQVTSCAKRKLSIIHSDKLLSRVNGAEILGDHGDTGTIMFEEGRSESPAHKHHRTKHQLIGDLPQIARSPSPQQDPVFLYRTETFEVYGDEYHVYFHEITKEGAPNHSSSLSDCRHGGSGADFHSFNHDETSKVQGLEYQEKSVYESAHITFAQSLNQNERFVFGLPDQIASEGFGNAHQQSINWIEQSQFSIHPDEFTPLQNSNSATPEVLAPQPVRFPPEATKARLLFDYCKNCGSKCCHRNGKYDCQVLYKGETCAGCGHQGCLDWNELLAEEGVPGVKRGENGMIEGFAVCAICNRQDCGDLVGPECSRRCGYQMCEICEENGGKEMIMGDCGHSCHSCKIMENMPAVMVEKQACRECGQAVECVPLKSMEEWELYWYDDEMVRGEREFQAYIRDLPRRLGL